MLKHRNTYENESHCVRNLTVLYHLNSFDTNLCNRVNHLHVFFFSHVWRIALSLAQHFFMGYEMYYFTL